MIKILKKSRTLFLFFAHTRKSTSQKANRYSLFTFFVFSTHQRTCGASSVHTQPLKSAQKHNIHTHAIHTTHEIRSKNAISYTRKEAE